MRRGEILITCYDALYSANSEGSNTCRTRNSSNHLPRFGRHLCNIKSSAPVKCGWFTDFRKGCQSINDLGSDVVMSNDRDTVKIDYGGSNPN